MLRFVQNSCQIVLTPKLLSALPFTMNKDQAHVRGPGVLSLSAVLEQSVLNSYYE